MQTYIPPVQLNNIDLNIPDICCKCSEEKETLCHYAEFSIDRFYTSWNND